MKKGLLMGIVLFVFLLLPALSTAEIVDLPKVNGIGYFMDTQTGYTWVDVDTFYWPYTSYTGILAANALGEGFHITSSQELDILLQNIHGNGLSLTEYKQVCHKMLEDQYGTLENVQGYFTMYNNTEVRRTYLDWRSDDSLIHRYDYSIPASELTSGSNFRLNTLLVSTLPRSLTISSTTGGSVTGPGEGAFPRYSPGQVVDLVATPDSGFEFVKWEGDVSTIVDVNNADTTVTMNSPYAVTAVFTKTPIPEYPSTKFYVPGGMFDNQDFGRAIAVQFDGTAIVGDPDDSGTGAAYVCLPPYNEPGNWDHYYNPDMMGYGSIRLSATDGSTGDRFGSAVDIDKNRIIIGAPADDNDNGNGSGSAYIFEATGEGWTQVAKLTAPDGAALEIFGSSVGIFHNMAVVGAKPINPFYGAVYLFNRTDEGDWVPTGKLVPSDGVLGDDFGQSIDIGAYGKMIIGAPDAVNGNGSRSGAAYVYDLYDLSGYFQWGGEVPPVIKLSPDDGETGDDFGYSVAINVTNYGFQAIVGASWDDASGSAYVFEMSNGGDLEKISKLKATDSAPGDYFGRSVAFYHSNANTGLDASVLVGAPWDDDKGTSSGSAYVFSPVDNDWYQAAKITAIDGAPGDYFGGSVAENYNGDGIIGAPNAGKHSGAKRGAAYFFSDGVTQTSISARDNVVVEPIPEMTLQFESVTSAGELSVIKSPASQPTPPANFSFASEVYSIEFTGSIDQPVSVCIQYDESTVTDENNLILFHWTGDIWEDITVSLNAETNTLCGETLSFSPFVIAEGQDEIPGDLDSDHDIDGKDIESFADQLADGTAEITIGAFAAEFGKIVLPD
ncbi:MAG: FG-GAP repeat protein [Desulfobacterium sp.]|nr:FG-GAP repeat protein [Desulfobacterium sp.]